MIQPGQSIPDVTLRIMGRKGVETVSSREVFAGKKAVLFGVPGAFTPTCTESHLPGYVLRAPELRERGIELIACVAVNDAFVMEAWAEARGALDAVLMLADGNAEFSRAMGLDIDLGAFGQGVRSRRYAAVIEDGVLRQLWVEPGAGVSVSGVEHVLRHLEPTSG